MPQQTSRFQKPFGITDLHLEQAFGESFHIHYL